MSDTEGTTRRNVLRCSAALALVWHLPAHANAVSAVSPIGRWQQATMRLFPHAASAEFVGRRALTVHADALAVTARALERVERHSFASADRNEEEAVMAALRDDYERSRILDVDGWMLSETEVAFCILAALSRSS